MTKSHRNQPSLALMCKSHDYKYIPSTGTFVTGNWVISNTRQQELLGENVVLTEGQKSSAYLGGRIVGFVPSTEPTKQTQCKVVFQANPSLVGDTTASGHFNWGCGRSVCYLD